MDGLGFRVNAKHYSPTGPQLIGKSYMDGLGSGWGESIRFVELLFMKPYIIIVV